MHQLHQSFYRWNLDLGVVCDTRVERQSEERRVMKKGRKRLI